MTQTEDLAQFDPASFEHIPVLLNECLDGLNIDPAGTYLDGTAGGAGHSRQIALRLDAAKGGRLISLDQDPDAVQTARDTPARSPSGWTAQKAGGSSPSTRTPMRCRPPGRGWPGSRPRWCR